MSICCFFFFKAGQHSDRFLQFLKFGPSTPPVSSSPASVKAQKSEIIKTLKDQSQAWNDGDIDAFMQDYLRSDDLRFASRGMVKYGWQTTLEGYRSRYPDKAAMGRLAFTDLDVDILSQTDALVFGRWTLTRNSGTPNGLFTLHMRKENDRWIIVSDHTSSAN